MILKPMLFIFALLFSQLGYCKIIDLTHSFDEKTIYWPTEKGFSRETVFVGQKPAGYFYSAFKFCAPEHGGTHLDAPIHFSRTGISIDQIKPEKLIGNCIVIDVHQKVEKNKDYQVTVEDIKQFEAHYQKLTPNDIVLFRTDWSKFWTNKKLYMGSDILGDTLHLHFPGISSAAAKYLVQAQIKGVGIDSASMDAGHSKNFLAHRTILGANLYGIENLTNLKNIPSTGSTIIVAPMKIKGGSGAPVRVFVVSTPKKLVLKDL